MTKIVGMTSGSFLKKRTRKLLRLWGDLTLRGRSQNRQKFFASFFQKRSPCFLSVAVAITLPGGEALAQQALTQGDVGGVISRVVSEANARGTPATIAVVDRAGAVLAVYVMANAPGALPVMKNPNGPSVGLNGANLPTVGEAISKAITGAYLSTTNGNAFSTRTASQIIQDHFDPGTRYASSGPLYGVQFSSLPCSDLVVRVNAADPSSLTRGPHRAPLGLAGDPGGFPLYKNGELVGGVGVKATGSYGIDMDIHNIVVVPDEALALAGTIGLDAPTNIRADQITVGGLLLRYSDVTPGNLVSNPAAAPPFASLPAGLTSVTGYYDATQGIRAGSAYGTPAFGIVQDTTGSINTSTQAYLLVDGNGNVRYPPTAGAGNEALSAAEVQSILSHAYSIALDARAQIRNSPGAHAAVTISVVDVNGTILGVASTPDAPQFGVDVSLQKARSAAFLSNPAAAAALQADPSSVGYYNAANSAFRRNEFSTGNAWSARAIGNISRDTLPDGINGSPNGPFGLPANLTTPFSDGLQLALVFNDLVNHVDFVAGLEATDIAPFCTELSAPPGSPTGMPVIANGLQVFPGGFPIYRGRVLVGGVGVSGDGVDQDDLISFLGLYNAGQALRTGVGHAPQGMRASTVSADGVEPHYANCPYAPFVNSQSHNVCSNK
jgi:uncharacterized protein GlcG (DUF336 family)